MIKFRYREEPSIITETVLRPIADVILKVNNTKVEAAMYIDSGADITLIPFGLGKALGLRQNSENKILEIKGVSGAGVPYILKEVILVLNEKELSIRLAWALTEEVPLLLGRLDIFAKFKITFDEKQKIVIFH